MFDPGPPDPGSPYMTTRKPPPNPAMASQEVMSRGRVLLVALCLIEFVALIGVLIVGML